jgi:PTH1 family peptidyl-tRNA hydrolase
MNIKFDLKNNPQPILMVGLGNIGKEYENTRHNIGFLFIDYFLTQIEQRKIEYLKQEQKLYYKYFIPELNLFLIKPKTLMNLSGLAVNKFLSYTKAIKDIIVVHDDLDLDIGDYKLHFEKGPKSHNGINSIISEINTSKFYRIRIGIENRQGIPIPGLDYVLYDLAPQELEQIKLVFDLILRRHFVI